MKLRHLLALLLFFPVMANAVETSDLLKRNGLSYVKFTDVPFTGKTSGRKQITYKDGEKHGPYEVYYKNGQLEVKTTLKDGKEHGPYEVYHKNGQLKQKLTHKDGKPDGPFEMYHENGQLKMKGTVKAGKLVNETCFTETGKAKPCG